MTIQESNFIYAGQSSSEYQVLAVDIESVNQESNDEASDLILSTTPYKNTWNFHGKIKTEPLKFKLTICKANGEFINAFEERELKKWLCKDLFNWLSFEQDDLFDCQYFCILSNPQKVNIGRQNGGLQFSVTCLSNCAWSNLRTKNYTCIGTSTFNFSNISDFDNYILSPTVKIVPTTNGTIKIKNNTTNQEVIINNCIQNEIITLDSENEMIDTSSNRSIISDWNVEFLNLKDSTNNITLTGNFTMQLSYRLPIRVGG